MSDHDDDDGDYTGSANWGSLYSSLFALGCGRSQPLSAAGRYLQTLESGDAARIESADDISEELQAQLRRIQIASMRPA